MEQGSEHYLLKIKIIILLLGVVLCSSTPIQPHPKNGHYFIFNNNPTILIASGEHYGAVLNLVCKERK